MEKTVHVRGWVYIIKNKAMPDLLKIGFSTKDPFIRAKDFDGAALPYPYIVVYDVMVYSPYDVEQAVHKELTHLRENKEWFRCSVLTAVTAIRKLTDGKRIVETEHVSFEGDAASERGGETETRIECHFRELEIGDQYQRPFDKGICIKVSPDEYMFRGGRYPADQGEVVCPVS